MSYPFLPVTLFEKKTYAAAARIHTTAYTFIYVMSGRYRRETDDGAVYDYGPDGLCMLPPDTALTIVPVGKPVLLCLGIHPVFFEENLPFAGILLCDSAKEPGNPYRAQKHCLLEMLSLSPISSPGSRLKAMEQLYRLLSALELDSVFLPDARAVPTKYQERLRNIAGYIEEHYAEPLSLAQAAEAVHLSPDYLSRFFKKAFGIGFREYLVRTRLSHAMKELCYTNDSPLDIALQNGFSGSTQFSRVFASHTGMSPAEYRRQKKTAAGGNSAGSGETLSPDGITGAKWPLENAKIPGASPGDRPNPPSVTLTGMSGVPFSRPMIGLLNIGSAANLLDSGFCQRLLAARKDYPFRFVRIQGLIRSSLVPQLHPSREYCFQKADQIFSFLYQNDLIPFLELTRLGDGHMDTGTLFPCFLNRNARYFELLENLLRHVRNFYPSSWTSQWRFELGAAHHDTPESYPALFGRVQKLVKRLLPGASVGGWGWRISRRRTEFSDMLKSLRKKGLSPDFVSVSASLEWNADGVRFLDGDRDLIGRETAHLRMILKEIFPESSFCLTQWTSVYSRQLPITASSFQAAFVCKSVLDSMDSCDLAGYWLLGEADRLTPSLTGQTAADWGQGLLGPGGFRLPAFYAFSFLSRMGSCLLQKGDGYCITSESSARYQILLYHYAHFEDPRLMEKFEKDHFYNVYDAFEETAPKPFHIVLGAIPPGLYRISRRLLDQEHGSMLDAQAVGCLGSGMPVRQWRSLIENMPPEEFEQFCRTVSPQFSLSYQRVRDRLVLDQTLAAHGVCFLELTRIEE